MKFFSVLDRKSNAARQLHSGIDPKTVENYLLEVDKPMVVPVNTKVRLLVTAADVIHSWWVPVFAVKQDAIPGYINEVWFTAREEGTYRGQCVELCGMDHGFMPIVVNVLEPHRLRQVARVAESRGADLAELRAMSGQVNGATERARKHREQP